MSKPLITDSVVEAARWLQKGQLLAYPTESVWGIGSLAINGQRLARAIKRRTDSDPAREPGTDSELCPGW